MRIEQARKCHAMLGGKETGFDSGEFVLRYPRNQVNVKKTDSLELLDYMHCFRKCHSDSTQGVDARCNDLKETVQPLSS